VAEQQNFKDFEKSVNGWSSEFRQTILDRIFLIFLTVPDEEMYGRVLDIILEATKSRFGIFGYIGENGNLVIPSLTKDVWAACRVADKSIVFPADAWGESLWGKAIREQKHFISDGPFNIPEGHIQIENFLTAPIVFGKKTIGLTSVANKEGGYTEEDKELLAVIGNRISPILNARLQRDIEERERRRAEDALRQSEATLRSIFKMAPVGLSIMKDRVYESANKTWYDAFGYSASDMIGHTTRILYENEAEYERVGRELYTDLPDRGLSSVQTRLRRKDGVFRDVVLTAAPLESMDSSARAIIAVQDITGLKQIEEELEESRRQLSDIIEFLPDATFVIDKRGRVIAWNRAIEVMTGIKKEDMLGRGDFEYALPFYGERRPILIDLALKADQHTEKKYTAIRRGADSLFGESFTPNLLSGDIHLSATASVLRDSRGEVIAAIECIRDNTERKKLEERLNRAEKMEALGTLAGGVAHDLNNILGVLTGYSELLLDKLPWDSPLRRYAENILNSGMRGAAIIEDLLTLARRGVNVSEVVPLNGIVSDYLRTPEFERLQDQYPNVKIRTELDKDLLHIKGSPVHLGKTLMNLVSNAAEAISGCGEVRILTKNCYLDQPIQGYDEVREGDYVVLTVSDTGRGIPAKDRTKIFEPFYTKKVMGRSGTGLGLTVVWGTVKDHEGYIDVRSEEDKGSEFTLYFPVTREEKGDIEDTVSFDNIMGDGESILVVDDVKEQRELAVSMLERLGYGVEAAAGGEAAIEYLKNRKVDLIVLDMIMEPGIDGLETYEKVLAISPGQKAIIVSGFSETERVRKTQALGAGEFVRKPYILEKIGLAVRKELDRKQAG